MVPELHDLEATNGPRETEKKPLEHSSSSFAKSERDLLSSLSSYDWGFVPSLLCRQTGFGRGLSSLSAYLQIHLATLKVDTKTQRGSDGHEGVDFRLGHPIKADKHIEDGGEGQDRAEEKEGNDAESRRHVGWNHKAGWDNRCDGKKMDDL